jgi:hypothetical protein
MEKKKSKLKNIFKYGVLAMTIGGLGACAVEDEEQSIGGTGEWTPITCEEIAEIGELSRDALIDKFCELSEEGAKIWGQTYEGYEKCLEGNQIIFDRAPTQEAMALRVKYRFESNKCQKAILDARGNKNQEFNPEEMKEFCNFTSLNSFMEYIGEIKDNCSLEL